MTELRKRLKTISFKNEGLQRVLRTCAGAIDIISVEKHTGGIHNTKVIFLMANGEHRIQFYDRVDIARAVPANFISSGQLAEDILTLNSAFGCDFTEDDLILVDGKYKAKPESLGYHNVEDVPGETPSTLSGDSITFNLSTEQTRGRQELYPKLAIRIGALDESGEIIDESLQLITAEVPIDGRWTDMAEQEIKRLVNVSPLSEMLTISSVPGESLEYGIIKTNYLITLTNKTNTPLEICINALSYHNFDDEGTSIVVFPILPNTRLTPHGAMASYSATSDTVRLMASNYVDYYEGIYNGEEYPSEFYYGELLSINGSTRNSYWQLPGESELRLSARPGPLSPYIESGHRSPVGPLVRIFFDTDSWDNNSVIDKAYEEGDYRHADDKVQVLMKNLNPTPIQINYAGFTGPINLLPHEDKTHPDEVLLPLGPITITHWNKQEITGVWVLSINGEEYVSNSSESRNYSTLFNDLFDEYPELKSMLNLQMMIDSASEIQYLYARNKTAQVLDIYLNPVTEEVGKSAHFILQPAGTPGITPTTSKSFLDMESEMDLITDLEITNMEEIDDIELLWRGTTPNGVIDEIFSPFLPVRTEENTVVAPLFTIGPFLETMVATAIFVDGTRKSFTYRLPPCPFVTLWDDIVEAIPAA